MRTYFIQAASGPVKIGKAKNVSMRLDALACSSFETLSILGVLDGDNEKRLHRRFKKSRLRGEWFQPSRALLAFIAANALSPVDPSLSDDESPEMGPGIFVRLDSETRARLVAAARADCRSVSGMVRRFVDKGLDALDARAADQQPVAVSA